MFAMTFSLSMSLVSQNILTNMIKIHILRYSFLSLALLLTTFFLVGGGCAQKVDAVEEYEFSISNLPYRTDATLNTPTTVSFRILGPALRDNLYTVRQFVHRGSAKVCLQSTNVEMAPNELYSLPYRDFKIIVTPTSYGEIAVSLYFFDKLGNHLERAISLNVPSPDGGDANAS